ncbi:hypothetical protein SGLAM104S_05059 [Streptomyces glaucescens]
MLDGVCAERRLPTARGGWVRFRGARLTARSVRLLPFERGWSSNVLSLVENDGTAYVHKTYRRLDETVREPELLRLMHRTGRTPDWPATTPTSTPPTAPTTRWACSTATHRVTASTCR